MIMAYGNTALQTYEKLLLVNELDEDMRKQVLASFDSYCRQGVIIGSSFDDDFWTLTDEIREKNLRFYICEPLFDKFTKAWIGCSHHSLVETIKSYIILMMGKNSLSTLSDILRSACRLGESSFDEAMNLEKDTYHLTEILKLLPGSSQKRDMVIEYLEDYKPWQIKPRSQRQMLDFPTYFHFHDRMEAFWKVGDPSVKLYYFPLYLWWNLTTILPLRVTEFLLIPRACLRIGDKGYMLTIRRTSLKGSDKKVSYKIQEDYESYEYPIPPSIADQILWYIEQTEDMNPSPIGSLFRIEAALQHVRGYRYSSLTQAYRYADLARALERFYVWKMEKDPNTSQIRLGDTRHIAMMNLIISGGSPSICMELAGHEDIDISSHYYSNMSSLVECATYEWYRKSRKGKKADIKGSKTYKKIKPIPPEAIRLANGWCTSVRWRNQDISDCIGSVNKNGEIGDCTCCRYYIPDQYGFKLDFFDSSNGKASVDADTWFLVQIIENVRKGLGADEDIRSAILRLQKSAFHYRECLIREWEEF